MAAVAEFDHDSQTLLRGHRGVLPGVLFIGLLEAVEDASRLLHGFIIDAERSSIYRMRGWRWGCP
jgi:hypothetical protein